MKYVMIVFAGFSALLVGCTAVDVRPVSMSERMTEVAIRRNPKVVVSDFLDVLVAGFQRHGIATKIITDDIELKDRYVVNYVATRNWDMAPYLSEATISIDRNGRRIGEAKYHLRGKGGMSLMKWQGTKAKMDPVIDQLLSGIGPTIVTQAPMVGGQTSDTNAILTGTETKVGAMKDADFYAQLKSLGELKEKGLLTEEEFQKEKKRLLDTRDK